MAKQKKALVAGGAGFVGSHLCEYLLDRGYQVAAMDNLVTGQRKNIEHLLKRGLNWLDSNLITAHPLNEEFDEIYNLASPASPADFEMMPIFILKTAALGHMNMLEMGRTFGCPVLFASTSEVYGDPLEHPQKETYLGNVNTVGVRGCYDEAKRFGEALSVAYQREHKVPIRIARIFNTYGPRMRPEDGRIVPNFAAQSLRGESLTIHGDGQQTRSFCFVSDLVEGLFRLMQSQETTPVNLGNPDERTVLEMADLINQHTGNKAPHRFVPAPPDDPRRRCPDISKAKKVLGWEPKISLRDGLNQTMDFFSTHSNGRNP